MHVIVVGAGIAGLGAAWRLRKQGHRVTLIEKEAEPGGRCRSVQWNGLWAVTGAFAFLGSESNLIEQATELGIYEPQALLDLTAAHRWHVLVKGRGPVDFGAFDLLTAARHRMIPLREKVGLLAALPSLARRMAAADPHDITSAAPFDDETACDHLRRFSPTFVDYFLEPSLGMFCGYAEQDYSLAWLAWSSSGRLSWSGATMWTFRERGAGRLTWALGRHFEQDPGTRFLPGHQVHGLDAQADGVQVRFQGPSGAATELQADAAVVAVPGHLVAPMMPGLDASRRAFFEGIHYAGHHIFYFLLDRPKGDLLDSYVLPAVDGFRRTGNLRFVDLGDGRTFAHSQWKEPGCTSHAGDDEQTLLDLAWSDVLDALPQLQGTRVLDRMASLQPAAICKRPVGHVRSVRDFRALGELPRVSFCGDYLANSTVGQSHWSGWQAADSLMRRCAGAPA